jgi:hypothetical protein
MDKKLLIFILILFLLVTTLVCIFRPKTHKHIMFENKNFKLSMMTQKSEAQKTDYNYELDSIEMPDFTVDIPNVQIKTPQFEFKQSEPRQQRQANEKSSVGTSNSTKSTETKAKPSAAKFVQKSLAEKPKSSANKPSQKPSNKTVQKSSTDKTEPSSSAHKPSSSTQKPAMASKPNKTVEQPKPAQKTQIVSKPEPKKETLKASANKQLTAEQLEVIAWNKWRSDLQNKLMRDANISAPIGTTFYFSFTVDKAGNISNLKTWSNNSSYTPLAVRVLKPLLLSYQKTPILNFPANSKRIITNAEGSFTMANSTRYSSPSDYNDYERIKR